MIRKSVAKIARLALTAVGAFIASDAHAAPPGPWEAIYEKTQPGVVYILSEGLCSGAFVAEDLVLTAAHCVTGMRTLRVGWGKETRKRGQYEFESGVTVAAIAPRDDVAVLRIPGKRTDHILTLAPAGYPYKAGQTIATIGHPSALNPFSSTGLSESQLFLLTQGIVANPGEDLVVSDMLVLPGNSGGPVLNDAGTVVGVVSARHREGDLAYFVPASRIAPVMDAARKNTQDARRRAFVGPGAVALTLALDADRLLPHLYGGHQNIALLAPSILFFDLVRARYSTRVGPQDARKRQWDGSIVAKVEISRLVDATFGVGAGQVFYEDETRDERSESPVVVFHAGVLGVEIGFDLPTRDLGRPSFRFGTDLLQLF